MPCKVLIVEDETVVAMLLESHLADNGYEIIGTAATGAAALAKAEAGNPDLVLMDININGPTDGIDTANEMRLRYGTAVVFLTAYADHETVQRAKATGPFGYLLKPFRHDELLAAIEVAVERNRMNREERLRDQNKP